MEVKKNLQSSREGIPVRRSSLFRPQVTEDTVLITELISDNVETTDYMKRLLEENTQWSEKAMMLRKILASLEENMKYLSQTPIDVSEYKAFLIQYENFCSSTDILSETYLQLEKVSEVIEAYSDNAVSSTVQQLCNGINKRQIMKNDLKVLYLR